MCYTPLAPEYEWESPLFFAFPTGSVRVACNVSHTPNLVLSPPSRDGAKSQRERVLRFLTASLFNPGHIIGICNLEIFKVLPLTTFGTESHCLPLHSYLPPPALIEARQRVTESEASGLLFPYFFNRPTHLSLLRADSSYFCIDCRN